MTRSRSSAASFDSTCPDSSAASFDSTRPDSSAASFDSTRPDSSAASSNPTRSGLIDRLIQPDLTGLIGLVFRLDPSGLINDLIQTDLSGLISRLIQPDPTELINRLTRICFVSNRIQDIRVLYDWGVQRLGYGTDRTCNRGKDRRKKEEQDRKHRNYDNEEKDGERPQWVKRRTANWLTSGIANATELPLCSPRSTGSIPV